LNLADLKEYFEYNPTTGNLIWKKNWYQSKVGKIVNKIGKNGYIFLDFKTHRMYAHRVVFALFYDNWPDSHVDHINGIKHDNRISNLRLASPSQNLHNMKSHPRNTSGVKGVYWNKQKKKWQAQIRANGKVRNLGRFNDIKDAESVVRKFREELHGEFTNHG
jgi:hypothetical protein